MSGAAAVTDAETALEAPYVGLNYYTEADAHLFFGRDEERKKIIGNLRTSRLTILYASSGVGKSSLLRAGVASRLRELASARPASGGARYIPVVFSSWRDNSVGALVSEVRATIEATVPEAAMPSPGTLERAIEQVVGEIDATLLVILDQFEEYFLYHPGETALANEIARCVNRPDLRVRFLISIREDAYARLGGLFKGRIPNVYGNYLHLGHLGREAARQAIRRPLERWGELSTGAPTVEIEPQLVEAVLGQVRTGEVALEAVGRGAPERSGGVSSDGDEIETPYLQLVMKRLWDAEISAGSRMLRLTTLTRLGGADAIVKTHLDAALSGLSPHERTVAVDVFHHLITPSRAKIAHDIPSLAEYTGHSEAEVGALLETLSRGDARIVRHVPPPPGGDGNPRYEVFHDVLAAPILDWRARQRADRLEQERRRLEVRSARLLCGLVSVVAIAVALMVYVAQPGALQRLDLGTIDARFGLRGNNRPSDIVLVTIDRATLRALANPATGRVPRTDEARVIDRIWRARPAVIAEDILYDDALAGDSELFSTIRRARGHVVLAAVTLNSAGDTTLFGHDPAVGEGGRAFVRGLGAEPGYVGVTPDKDRRLRHFQSSTGLGGAGSARMSTLPVVAARLAGRHVSDFGTAWIDYRGTAGTIPRISFLDLLKGRVAPSRLRGKVVLVGATIPGVDAYPTPAGGGSTMPGVEILANATWTALHGLPLEGSRGVDVVLIVVLGLVPLCVLLVRPMLALLACLLAGGLFLLAVQLAFDADLIMSVVYPLLALILSTLGVFVTQAVLRRLAAKRVAR